MFQTLREKFQGDKTAKVRLIYNVWKAPDCTDLKQIQTPYTNLEDIVEKYPDFIYEGWYTEGWTDNGRWKASLWARAAGDERYAPELFEKKKNETNT